MKTWAEELGFPLGIALIVLASGFYGRIDNKADQCAKACSDRGVASFRMVSQGCASDTPLCECASPPPAPTADGGAP